jgi:hypothetical protein
MNASLSTTWHVWGSSSTSPLIPKLGKRCGWGVISRHQPLYPRVVSRGILSRLERRIICRESKHDPRSSIPYLGHYTNWAIRLPRHKEKIRRFCKLRIAQKSKKLHWKRNKTGNTFSFRWLIVHLQSELGPVYLLLPDSAVIQPPLPEMMDELINAVPSKNTYQLIQSLKQQTALNFVAGVSRWSLTEPAISRPGVHHQVQEPLEGHSDKANPL